MTEISPAESLVQEMLANTLEWDQSVEDGTRIIQRNQTLMTRYQQLELAVMSDEELVSLERLISQTKAIQQVIKAERQVVLKELNQTTKTDKMIDGYLLQHADSVFIDKDF